MIALVGTVGEKLINDFTIHITLHIYYSGHSNKLQATVGRRRINSLTKTYIRLEYDELNR
jgi:hypothetical protein